MTIQWFDDDNQATDDELPWLKDYILSGEDYETPVKITECYLGLRGILILTNRWKGFLFKGSKTYTQLAEALDVYVTSKNGCYLLIARSNRAGKIALGLDKSTDMMYWVVEGTCFRQKSSIGDGQESDSNLTNPLLDTPIPSTNTTNGIGAHPRGSKAKSRQ